MKTRFVLFFCLISSFIYSEVKFNPHLDITGEGYFQTNPNVKYWDYSYFNRNPLFTAGFDFTINNYLYGYADFPLMRDRLIMEDYKTFTNIILHTNDIDFNVPNKAFLELSLEHIKLSFGRNLLTLGEGLILAPNTFYHDYLSLDLNIKYFNYGLVLVNFSDEDIKLPTGVKKETDNKILIAHVISFKFKELLNITLTESGIIGGRDTGFKIFNPFTIIHNEYLSISDYGNAFTAIGLNWYPLENLEIIGNIGIDQFETSFEATRWDQEEPNAIGFILGANYGFKVDRLKIESRCKFTHTDPYLGLDSSGINYTTTKKYVTHSQGDKDDANGIPVIDFLGIGPDRQILELGGTLRGVGNFIFSLDYKFTRRGDITVDSIIKPYDSEAINKKTPSGKTDVINVLTLGVGYLYNNLNASTRVSYINFNGDNTVQFVISLGYSL